MVRALQADGGMALIAAATVIAELGDITRFANPRQRWRISALVPAERSAAPHDQGGITKAGNGAARRMLIEAAWSYRFPGAHQPGVTAAPGGSGQADPRHRVEGPRAVVSALSQARPGGKITHCGHDRDRSELAGLPGRSPSTFRSWAREALRSLATPRKEVTADSTSKPKPSKAGGTVTARRTLESTISRIFPDAGP